MLNPKICWAGWTGPDMAEIASGILPIDPDPHFYVLGSGMVRDERAYYLGFNNRVSYFTDSNRFFSDVVTGGYDVLIHNTFVYSVGHRPEIHPIRDGALTILDDPRWQSLPCFKILHEGESFTQFAFYEGIIDKFDGVISYNPRLRELCEKRGIPCYQTFICCPAGLDDPGLDRDIDVSYTGNNLRRGYRGEIAATLESFADHCRISIQDGGFGGLSVDRYVNLLNRSKLHQCTHSNPNGAREPFAVKNREGKALLCGAAPICEVFDQADAYLAPDTEKIVFESMGELAEKVAHYLEHDAERQAIVTAGQKKIRENFTCDILFRRAFALFGLISEDDDVKPAPLDT